MKDKGILENLEILIDCGAGHLGIVGRIGEVYNRPITKSSRSEKATEGRDVTSRALGNNFTEKSLRDDFADRITIP